MKDLFFQFFVIEKALSRIFDRVYREHGISTKQWLVLVVAIHAEKATVSFIAETLHTSHQNVKVIARNLERKGWVQLVPSPKDARATLVLPTEKVLSFGELQNGRDMKNLSRLFDVFTLPELEALAGKLAKFKSHLENCQDKLI